MIILTSIWVTVIVMAVFLGMRLSDAQIKEAKDEANNHKREIKLLRGQNRALSSQVRHLKETSKTLDQIKKKVYQINKRRSSLVKWAALPERGGDWINRIDRYLAATPLSGQGRTFYLSAVDAGIEPRLMPAIAMIESGAGRANANSNNFFGRRAVRGGWASWTTKEAAINNQGQYIAKMWGHATNPYQMRGYATSPVWKGKVATQMAKI
ncbi:MAG TPA: hypothetical protein ENI11_06385 [Actinobacteria bacterium]|nr:hypothetical protein [Actinomycetota bacterium]